MDEYTQGLLEKEPGKLNLEERAFLQDRMLLPAGAREVTGDQMREMQQELADEREARNRLQPAEDDLENLPYAEWSKKQLVEEIDARNADRDDDAKLSKSGTKPELVEALEADDEA